MFDRLAWRREFYERYLLGQDDEEEDDEKEDDDYETPMGDLAPVADDVEAGRVELPPRWKLDRPSPGVKVPLSPPRS